MIKPLVQIGDPRVRVKSKNIKLSEINSPEVKRLIKNLTDTMRKTGLIGIAAPQIGVNLNVFVTELRPTSSRANIKIRDKLRVFINPRLVDLTGRETVLMEGCGSLSFGGLFGPVRRPSRVTVAALNEQGEKFELKATGLMAKLIQHEYDHLQGIICLDKFIETRKVKTKLRK